MFEICAFPQPTFYMLQLEIYVAICTTFPARDVPWGG